MSAAAFALAAILPPASQAQETTLLNQGFNDVSALSNWTWANKSAQPGTGWFQGNADIFQAQSGASNSYIAANFLSAQLGMGGVDNWLITPTLTLAGDNVLSFFTRSSAEPGFADKLEVRFSAGNGVDTAGFTTLLGTIGPSGFPSDWQQFSTSLAFDGTGRFAFRYLGDASTLSYIGIDSVKVVSAVPEPSTYLMLGLGLGLLGFMRRKVSN
jgi:hypothetical protein